MQTFPSTLMTSGLPISPSRNGAGRLRLKWTPVLLQNVLAGDRGIPEEAMADVGAGPGAGSGGFEFGVDPALDPELAMASLSNTNFHSIAAC